MKVRIYWLLFCNFLLQFSKGGIISSSCYFQYGSESGEFGNWDGQCLCGPKKQFVGYENNKYCCVQNRDSCTGKSLSEALIFASTNPQLWRQIVHWITSSIHENSKLKPGENMLCTKIVSDIQNNFCTQHVLPMFCKKKSFWQRFTCTSTEKPIWWKISGQKILSKYFSSSFFKEIICQH